MTRDPKLLEKAIQPERLHETLLDLLDIYSPSGKEADITAYLEKLLRGAGIAVEHQEVEEDRYNLSAAMGPGEPFLYLVGHVDTVASWDLEALGTREEKGVLYGLGSADMKGGCAAMVEAWLALAETLQVDERPPVGLLLVVGEEENGDGSAAFLDRCRPPWAVIGEPTGLSACFSHYGYLEANFITRGRRSHSSLPELGHNAVESMLRLLLHLGKNTLFDRDKSDVVYSIREMNSSPAGFVVPDRCETWIDLHLPPDREPMIIQEAIRRGIEGAHRYIPDLDVEISFDVSYGGYDLGADNSMASLLKEIYADLNIPFRQDAFRSHSDGNLFYAAGTKPILLGPGSLETAHTSEEQVPFREVLAAARIYAALCLNLVPEKTDDPAVK
ncbi:MAG: putative succinyl-diaminopimelate desuccinylase [Syntrophus sp. PtaU1.Bin005]|jgi:acetylornithine deacetylase|uniref:M20 family metallopeptidase n=1 Tax=Syntrophus TaxID=43773 RepID=UPI0009C7D09D|nr:MAG: putative succinyl-diaminopimelate desuccinylase [Syntrophus sp. PtaB.Bin138]OPY77743.1 MAG: putative succinyl-diaminopimelate desuccinylase [Syntrophus sp. PtaU1.Bin005]